MKNIIFNRKLLKYCCIFTIVIKLSFSTAASDRPNYSNLSISQAVSEPQKIDLERRSTWANAEKVDVLEAHHRSITLLRFSADGRLLASVEPGAIAIWQLRTGEVLRILPGHDASTLPIALAPTDVAFSPDGNYLATATWSQGKLKAEKAVVVWDVKTGTEVASFNEATGCQQIIFSPQGDKLYGACGLGVQVWDLATGKKLFSFAGERSISAIALSHDGKVMAIAITQEKPASNYKIQLWQLDKDRAIQVNKVLEHHSPIAQLDFTAGDRRLVGSSYGGEIKVWNWQTKTASSPVLLKSQISNFSLSADGNLIASDFTTSAIANLTTGLPLKTAIELPQQGQASAIAFSPQEPILAWAGQPSAYPNPVIFLWQAGRTNSLTRSRSTIARDEYVTLNLAGKKIADDVSAASSLSLVGKDPEAIALAALLHGRNTAIEVAETKLETALNYSNNLAIVTITQTNLADDSVFGIRYRLEFAPFGAREKALWRVIWAGEQYQCQANRGSRTWSKKLCQ